jgi:hypothetical protein
VQDSDIIVLDTPSGEVIEISSSSCNRSIFSSKAGSQCDEGAGAMPGGSSCVSIGELWPEINKLDETGREGTSIGSCQEEAPPRPSSVQPVRGTNEGGTPLIRRAPIDDALGPSSAPSSGYSRGPTKNKAAQILSDCPRAVSSYMRRSFIDRQYSPSTGMDQSEWEIILEELTRMGHIVKQEPVNETDD